MPSLIRTSALKAAAIAICLGGASLAGQVAPGTQSSDYQSAEKALRAYIDGTSFSDPDLIRSAFTPSALLLLEKDDQPLWEVPATTYAEWFADDGKPTGRIGEIMGIEIDGDIATAKVEILMPNREVRFVDLFLMKRIEGDWKIISKTADSAPSNRTGERVLLIVSDARHHGDTDIPAGISFEEAFTAYDVFEREGYTVDFVSPNGGPVPLTYIQMSDPEHMDHIYDTDFMAKLKDTKAPDEVDPGDYRAVQFIGGSNAMYGVPENEAIQAIAMTIYEEQGGVISAVCHGTAGVTALKTKDGRYLVDGKRLTGFPEDYEKKDAAYFDAFPFLIGETVKKRGGAFSFAPKRLPHVIEDGRLITGQNPASSEALAEAVVDRLRAE